VQQLDSAQQGQRERERRDPELDDVIDEQESIILDQLKESQWCAGVR